MNVLISFRSIATECNVITSISNDNLINGVGFWYNGCMLSLKSSLIHHSWCGAFSNFINDLLYRSPESQALQTLNSIKKNYPG